MIDIAAEPETLDRAAARWFARRRSGEMTPAEGLELEAWLEQDPAHRAAFDTVRQAWASAGLMRTSPEVLTLRARHRGRKPLLRPRAFGAGSIAAGVALAVSAGLGIAASGVLDFHRLQNQAFHTGVGERSTVTLPDGSVVTLNTDTVLHTRAMRGQRLVYLDRGQAYFKVAKDPSRPFVVTAAGRTVTAVGTAFDVRVDRGRFQVTLVEGKVRVGAPTARTVQTTEMVAGNQFVAAGPDHWSVGRTDAAKETTWVTGWLKFDNDRLSDVVGELSRYSDRKIVLEDAALADVPVSGRFRPEDIDTFVRSLQTYRLARVDAVTPTQIRLAAP